jgi:hypothetical protein
LWLSAIGSFAERARLDYPESAAIVDKWCQAAVRLASLRRPVRATPGTEAYEPIAACELVVVAR